MAFVGLSEVFLVLLMFGGETFTDAVSLVPTAPYFKSRNVEVSHDKLIDLAGQNPSDPKTQILQLVALKALAEDSAKLKESPKIKEYRAVLEAIAQGKKAKDRTGFAPEYALKALAALDGKPLPMKESPARDFEQGLSWFPKEAIFAGQFANRATNASLSGRYLAESWDKLPEGIAEQAFGVIEQIGNVRIDRISFAVAPSKLEGDRFLAVGKRSKALEIFVRVTGRLNTDWMVAYLRKNADNVGKLKIDETKDENGTELTAINPHDHLSLMYVGDAELMIAAYVRVRYADHQNLVQKMLGLRSGKGDNLLKGPLSAELKKLPEKTTALLVGTIPESDWLTQKEFPKHVFSYLKSAPQGRDLFAEVTLGSAEIAEGVAKDILASQKWALGALDGLKAMPGIPNLGALIATLESLQVQANETKVSVRLAISNDAIATLPALMFLIRGGP